MTAVPKQRELQRHVTPQYATEWKQIGVELGLTDAKLRAIRQDNPHRITDCCNEMFSEWLRMDPTATWEKLFVAIESPAVSGDLFVHVSFIFVVTNKLMLCCPNSYKPDT